MSFDDAATGERRVKEQAIRLLQRMQSKLDAAEARLTAPVAIVGTACRFPLGDTPQGTLEYQTIFAVGMLLFLMTFALNLVSTWLRERFRQEYA